MQSCKPIKYSMLKCYRTNIEFRSALNSVARQKGLYEDSIYMGGGHLCSHGSELKMLCLEVTW